MNNNEITFLNNENVIQQMNSTDNSNTFNSINNNNVNYSQPINNNEVNDTVTLPDWDLTPPFDSIDRGDMS